MGIWSGRSAPCDAHLRKFYGGPIWGPKRSAMLACIAVNIFDITLAITVTGRPARQAGGGGTRGLVDGNRYGAMPPLGPGIFVSDARCPRTGGPDR
jgi:hypothetical protein